MDNEKPWYGDLMDFILFSLFVQMAECTSCGGYSQDRRRSARPAGLKFVDIPDGLAFLGTYL